MSRPDDRLPPEESDPEDLEASQETGRDIEPQVMQGLVERHQEPGLHYAAGGPLAQDEFPRMELPAHIEQRLSFSMHAPQPMDVTIDPRLQAMRMQSPYHVAGSAVPQAEIERMHLAPNEVPRSSPHLSGHRFM